MKVLQVCMCGLSKVNVLFYHLFLYRGHQGVVWCMSTKNKKLYTAGSDCMIKVWDLENLSRGCIKTIQGHTGEVGTFGSWGHFITI